MHYNLELNFWSPERLRRVAISLLIAIVIGLCIGYTLDPNRSSLLKRGDFPGFYVLAILHSTNQISNIYNPELQRSIENQYWPSFNGSFYMSVYPPYDATLLAPLAYLPAQTAQFVFSGIMISLFIITCKIISQLNPYFAINIFANSVLLLCFAPLFYAIFGAQNTALSMFLYAVSLYFFKQETNKADFFAGIAIGLWLFKPQFACFFILIALIGKRWNTLLGATIPAAIFYSLAAYHLGIFWPVEWAHALSQFSQQNFISNAAQNVSIIGTAKAIAFYLGADSNVSIVLTFFSIILFAYLGLQFLRRVWLGKKSASLQESSTYELLLYFGPLLLLLSPQTLFYDLGIGLVSLAAIINFEKDKTYWSLIVLILLSLPIVYFRELFAIPIFIFFPVLYFYLIRNLQQKSANI